MAEAKVILCPVATTSSVNSAVEKKDPQSGVFFCFVLVLKTQ